MPHPGVESLLATCKGMSAVEVPRDRATLGTLLLSSMAALSPSWLAPAVPSPSIGTPWFPVPGCIAPDVPGRDPEPPFTPVLLSDGTDAPIAAAAAATGF